MPRVSTSNASKEVAVSASEEDIRQFEARISHWEEQGKGNQERGSALRSEMEGVNEYFESGRKCHRVGKFMIAVNELDGILTNVANDFQGNDNVTMDL